MKMMMLLDAMLLGNFDGSFGHLTSKILNDKSSTRYTEYTCLAFWTDHQHQQDKAVLYAIGALVRKYVFRFVSQLVQIRQTGILYHWWRTTQDNKDISGRRREVILDHVIGHKS